MYESYFNLKSKPFDLAPNPEYMFLSRSHKKALTFLDYGIRERAGFIMLTGDVGSGKTTLIRDLMTKHYDRVVLAKVFNTKVNSEQLLAMINDEFGLPVQGRDKITLIRELNGFLIDQYAKGNLPTLIIDEAQNLGLELLEEIRMLSNLETADSKLLQIILVGQPELRTILSSSALLQLRQRISINCQLKPLDRFETEQYIQHRLAVAGSSGAVIFATESFDVIHTASRGIPRLINIICDFALLTAFAEKTHTIDADLLRDIVADLDFEHHFWAESHEIVAGTHLEDILATEHGAGKNPEIIRLLTDISSRLARLENNAVQVNETALKELLKEFNNRLISLQGALKSHMSETETLYVGLSNKIDLARKKVPYENGTMTLDKSSASFHKVGK